MKEIKHNIDNYPKQLDTIYNVFNNNGHQLLLVGGCVRDSILGKEPKDWDLVTDATPERIMELLKDIPNLKYIDENSVFGVIDIIYGGESFEIVTFRGDGEYLDNRRPESVFFGDIYLDSKRRDFTINSLYYDFVKQVIYDLNDGLTDLNNNTIKFIGNPLDRLREDGLRYLRLIRFSLTYNMKFDSSVLEDIFLEGLNDVSKISKERVVNELNKIVDKGIGFETILNKLKEFKIEDALLDNSIQKGYAKCDLSGEFYEFIAYMIINSTFDFKNKTYKTINKLKINNKDNKRIMFLLGSLLIEIEDDNYYTYNIHKLWESYKVYFDNTNFLPFAKSMIRNNKYKLFEKIIKFDNHVSSTEVIEEFGLSGKELGEKITQININRILCEM